MAGHDRHDGRAATPARLPPASARPSAHPILRRAGRRFPRAHYRWIEVRPCRYLPRVARWAQRKQRGGYSVVPLEARPFGLPATVTSMPLPYSRRVAFLASSIVAAWIRLLRRWM